MKETISIYDFCHTLVNFETADEFVHYLMTVTNNSRMKRLEILRIILVKTKIMKIISRVFRQKNAFCLLNKAWVLYELKGLTKSKIDEYAAAYYTDEIKPNLIPEVLSSLKKHKQQGHRIVIVSASYYPFLKLFMDEYKIDDVVTNTFLFDENVFTGRIEKTDCRGANKVKCFQELCEKKYNGLQNVSVAYSYGDSISDRFILDIAENAVVVSENKHQNWIEKYDYSEIIYSK